MPDRIVRQIFPKLPPEATGQVWKFSDFANQPNIVLVGDPGAGKSHLMSETAGADNGHLLTTRTFLNDPTIPLHSVLFIDALDEKRAGRRDQATIDAVVQKLFQLNPKKVRIACREHDWLGGTDLEAFRPYFDQHGGTFVLGLEPLTRAEQYGILSAHGVTDPAGFVREAENRGLHEFLVNPQNLIMLIEAVRDGNWPETRIKLFESTSQLLLREHSTTHARFGSGVFTAAEIREAAGAACALRLISDVAGIMVRSRLQPLGVQVEPEGHMVADKRADISVALPGRKSLVELKRDTHPDVWKAHETQLEEFYARDPDASGHGTYGVFWFGPRRQGKIPVQPDGGAAPTTAKQMEAALNSMIPANKRERLKAVVIDVSGPASGAAGQKKRKAKSKKEKKKKPTKRKSSAHVGSRATSKTSMKGRRAKRKSRSSR